MAAGATAESGSSHEMILLMSLTGRSAHIVAFQCRRRRADGAGSLLIFLYDCMKRRRAEDGVRRSGWIEALIAAMTLLEKNGQLTLGLLIW